jgi:hypothetical protein
MSQQVQDNMLASYKDILVKSFSFNNWAINMAGVHKLSKNVGATSKFCVLAG